LNINVTTAKITPIFLATVLVLGTIALSSPSFMTGAQAEPYYGMDKTYKKSNGKDVSVKSVKCKNVNVNVNGLELNVLPPTLANLLSSGDEGERGAASYGSGGQSGYDNNSFKFICINNNNNVFVEQESPIPPVEECAETEDIVACFNQFLGRELTLTLKAELESPAGVTIEINGVNVTFESFEDLCSELRGLTFQQLSDAIVDIIEEAGIITMIDIGLIDCIAEALGIPVPPV
jgi:hypothetical protein